MRTSSVERQRRQAIKDLEMEIKGVKKKLVDEISKLKGYAAKAIDERMKIIEDHKDALKRAM